MNRGTGLTRSAPLAAGKGLSRGKGLERGTSTLTRSAPLEQGGTLARRAAAARPRKPRVAQDVRDAVLARSRGLCEVAAIPECRARRRSLDSAVGGSVQHRLPGRMGGSKRAAVHSAANLLQVCGSGTTGCHGHMESQRELALRNGWLLHEGADPAAEPALIHTGRRVLLTADGYEPVEAGGDAVTAPYYGP